MAPFTNVHFLDPELRFLIQWVLPRLGGVKNVRRTWCHAGCATYLPNPQYNVSSTLPTKQALLEKKRDNIWTYFQLGRSKEK